MRNETEKLVKEQIVALQNVYENLFEHANTPENFNADIGLLLQDNALDTQKILRRLQSLLINY